MQGTPKPTSDCLGQVEILFGHVTFDITCLVIESYLLIISAI